MAEGDFDIRAIISANTSNFEKGMKSAQTSLNSVSKSIEGVQKLLKSAFSLVGITASVGAVVNFGKKAVTSADEANKRFNILANTIKATGASTWTSVEELDKMAKAYAESTDYSVAEVEKMQSVLLGFRNITGDTFQEASDAIMDMATVMGMDLTSAVQTVGKALDDPVKGLDSLRRQGFQFTDEQKAELAQLIKNGDQLKAQKIILDELATTYGGASKAGQSAFARLQHTMDAFRENIGNKLMPVVNTVMDKMSESMNRVTSIINSADFDRFVSIVVNVGNKIKGVLENISGEIKRTFDSIKATVNSVDFGPFMKIMDTLVALVQKTFSEIKQNIQNSFATFSELKERMGIFTDALDLDKIVNIINTVVDVFVFLRDEIKSVGDEIRKLIFDNIVKIWNYIKQVFENSNDALMNSESSIKSWGDFFYETFNNIFKIFQDLFGSIKAILTGDWEVAWEYAKLAVMRMADNVLNALSTIMNAFPKMVNKIIDGVNAIISGINKIREWLGDDPLGLVKSFESVDLSESSGLNAKITQAEKKIEELTGKSADISIKQLQGISKVASGFTQRFIKDITDTTNVVGANADQRKKYEVSSYQGIENEAENTYKIISDWDLKLLNQQLDDLKEYSGKYHDISLQLIEAERQKALEADKTGADTEKINKYYNKQIEKENKRHIKAVLKQIGSILGKVSDTIKNIASKTLNGIKSIISSMKSIFTFSINLDPDEAIVNLLKFEDKILTFFVETLPKLPSYLESAIQSIIVLIDNLISSIDFNKIYDDLQKMIDVIISNLPSAFSKIITTITGLLKTISDVIENNVDKISDFLSEMIEGFIENLPSIMNSVTTIISSLITSLLNVIGKNLPSLLKAINDFLPTLLEKISGILTKIGEIIIENIPTLVQIIFQVVGSLIKEFPKILSKIIEAIPALILGIVESLPKFFEEDLPIFIKGMVELIPTIVKALVQLTVEIITHLPEIVVSIITGLIKAFTEVNWWQVIKDIFQGFIDGFKKLFGINSPSTVFEGFGTNIFQGLMNGLKGIGDWLIGIFTTALNGIKKIFANIGDWAKGVWNNIKSGFDNVGDWFSTTFSNARDKTKEAFSNMKSWASNVWGDIKSGFGNVGDWFSSTFSDACSKMKNAFSGVKDWFKNLFTNIFDNAKSLASKAIDGISDTAQKIGGGAKNVAEKVWDGVTDVAEKVWDGVTNVASNVGNAVASGAKAVGEVASKIGNSIAKGIKNIFGFATGTQSAPRGLAIVGEKGPELVKFRGGEQVVNNTNTQKLLSGTGSSNNNFSIVFNNTKDTTAYTMMRELKQYNRQMAINGII